MCSSDAPLYSCTRPSVLPVQIHICRPLSKRKCWMVTDILHRAKQFDAESAQRAAAAATQEHAASASAARVHHAPPPSFAAGGVTQ